MFCTLLLLLRTWQRKFNPDAEVVRKLFHLGMGLFTLALPYLFSAIWPVIVMCAVTVTLLVALRVSSSLRNKFGAVLGGVARCSHGELYFSLGVAALFALAKDDLVIYSVSILLLTFADAAAALVGKRFGFHRFGPKSLEGSLAFLLTAFICIAVPFSLFRDATLVPIWLLAATSALLLTLIEAVSSRGLDNLLLPIAAYVLLTDLEHRTANELSALLLLLIAMLLMVWAAHRKQKHVAEARL